MAKPSTKIESPGQPPSFADRVPDPETADGGRDLLLRRRGEQREHGEENQPVLVEEPDREQDQRNREADRVDPDRRERVELRRRVEQVRDANVAASRLLCRCLRASQYTGSAPARPRSPGRRAASAGSTRPTRTARAARGTDRRAPPRRDISCPVSVVISRKWPCAVDQTACIMFPRSNRGCRNAK